MDDWKKFNGTSLPENKDFYSHLNMEDFADADYVYTKRICKDFETKNLGVYHDLFVQSNTLLLADIFEKFRNICLKIYELDWSCKIHFSSWIIKGSSFKNTKVKLDLLTHVNMLLMVQKGIRGEICQKLIISSYIQYLDVNNLYGWAMLQNLPVNNFE